MERVPAGYVGVQYSMNGGIKDEVLKQGVKFVSPTINVKTFTIGNEQIILAKDAKDGSPDDDSFLVSTSDNANIKISFQMSYRYKVDEVVNTYTKFKGMNGADIVNSRVSTVLKAKISEVTSNYTMMEIYSGNRGEINNELTMFLGEALGEQFGIEVLDASIIDVHPDDDLQTTINNRVAALQKKEQAYAEQETIKVQAETKIIEAQAKADVIAIETAAEAARYEELSNAITSELLSKWEMDARLAHGWVTVQGANAIVTN